MGGLPTGCLTQPMRGPPMFAHLRDVGIGVSIGSGHRHTPKHIPRIVVVACWFLQLQRWGIIGATRVAHWNASSLPTLPTDGDSLQLRSLCRSGGSSPPPPCNYPFLDGKWGHTWGRPPLAWVGERVGWPHPTWE